MNEAIRSVVNHPARRSFDETNVVSTSTREHDGFRLCRAIMLVALGAAMHLPVPDVTPAEIPLIMPLQLAQSTAWRLERRVIVEQSLVFARRLTQLNHDVATERLGVARLAEATGGPLGIYPRLADMRVPLIPLDAIVTLASLDSGTVAELNSTQESSVTVVPAESTPLPAVATTASAASEMVIPVEDLRRVKSALTTPEHPPSEAAAAARRLTEEELVRRLIDEYTGALERLDVGAAQAAWPTVDGKALKKAFGQLSAQRLTLQSCGITISGSTANARCRGSATYQPRIGTRATQLPSREWTFDLSKKDTDWRIVNTLVR